MAVLEVGIDVVAQGDVAAIVDAQGGLDEDARTDFPKDALEHGLAVCSQGLRGGVVREVVVVGVHEASGPKPSLHQLGGKAVVSAS